MTSIVTVKACCTEDKELVLEVFDPADGRNMYHRILNNGEEHTVTIYDEITTVAYERKKQ